MAAFRILGPEGQAGCLGAAWIAGTLCLLLAYKYSHSFCFFLAKKKSQGSFSLIFLMEICSFLTESAELVKRAFSIRELFGWKISQLALLIPLTLFCHSSYLCISVWPLNQISSQGFYSYYSQRPSCNSWSTTDLRFITEAATRWATWPCISMHSPQPRRLEEAVC